MSVFRPVDGKRQTVSDNVTTYKEDTNRDENSRTITLVSKLKGLNYDSHQLCFLVYILSSKNYTVTIQKLYKKSTRVDQTIRIKKIVKDGITRFCDEQYLEDDEYSYNGDLKRKRRNIDSMTNNSLINLLELEGCHIFSKRNRDDPLIIFNHTERKRRIIKLIDSGTVYKRDDIDMLGKKVYDFLIPKITKFDYEFKINDLSF